MTKLKKASNKKAPKKVAISIDDGFLLVEPVAASALREYFGQNVEITYVKFSCANVMSENLRQSRIDAASQARALRKQSTIAVAVTHMSRYDKTRDKNRVVVSVICGSVMKAGSGGTFAVALQVVMHDVLSALSNK